jgi:hypothetical protein
MVTSGSDVSADATKERTPVDAFRELLSGEYEETKGIPWSITNLSRDKTFLSNGIRYCFVEVTFANGVQYGTEAYGEDALALLAEASSHIDLKSQQSLLRGEPTLITA